jgi:hypothetical protein
VTYGASHPRECFLAIKEVCLVLPGQFLRTTGFLLNACESAKTLLPLKCANDRKCFGRIPFCKVNSFPQKCLGHLLAGKDVLLAADIVGVSESELAATQHRIV